MSKYSIELNRIFCDLENLFCLNEAAKSGQPYKIGSIDEELDFSLKEADSLPQAAIKDLNVSVSKKAVLLAYTNSRMKFFDKKEVDFSNMPCLYDVASVLFKFTAKKSITSDTFTDLDKCIMVLEDMEKTKGNVNTLSYRLLRIFVLCVCYGLLCNAGIVADFALSQMIAKNV